VKVSKFTRLIQLIQHLVNLLTFIFFTSFQDKQSTSFVYNQSGNIGYFPSDDTSRHKYRSIFILLYQKRLTLVSICVDLCHQIKPIVCRAHMRIIYYNISRLIADEVEGLCTDYYIMCSAKANLQIRILSFFPLHRETL